MFPRQHLAFPIDFDALPAFPLVGQAGMAYWFAAGAHAAGDQKRATGEPYFTHCEEVAKLVSYALGTTGEDADWTAAVCTGLLHDTIEDPKVARARLAALFGDEVADGVVEVTDVSRPEDGPRHERKRIDREHVWKAGRIGQTVKLGDVCSNLKDIDKMAPGFQKVYVPEKRLLVPGLTKGHRLLQAQALFLIERWEERQRVSGHHP